MTCQTQNNAPITPRANPTSKPRARTTGIALGDPNEVAASRQRRLPPAAQQVHPDHPEHPIGSWPRFGRPASATRRWRPARTPVTDRREIRGGVEAQHLIDVRAKRLQTWGAPTGTASTIRVVPPRRSICAAPRTASPVVRPSPASTTVAFVGTERPSSMSRKGASTACVISHATGTPEGVTATTADGRCLRCINLWASRRPASRRLSNRGRPPVRVNGVPGWAVASSSAAGGISLPAGTSGGPVTSGEDKVRDFRGLRKRSATLRAPCQARIGKTPQPAR